MIFFDIILAAVVAAGGYYGYKKENLESIYRVLKLITAIGFSSKYALTLAMWLTKAGLLKAETFAILILIGFILVFTLFWLIVFILEIAGKKFFSGYINKNKKRISSFFCAIEFGIAFTIVIFLTVQFSWARDSVKPFFEKSYSYPLIHKFYREFLNDRFVNEVFLKGNGLNPKELIFEMGSSYLKK